MSYREISDLIDEIEAPGVARTRLVANLKLIFKKGRRDICHLICPEIGLSLAAYYGDSDLLKTYYDPYTVRTRKDSICGWMAEGGSMVTVQFFRNLGIYKKYTRAVALSLD